MSPAARNATVSPSGMDIPLMVMFVSVPINIVLGMRVSAGGEGGIAGEGAGGIGDGGGGEGLGGTGGGGEGGGGGSNGGGGEGRGGVGSPGWRACSTIPATIEKWPSCDGFTIVEWHILYIPMDGSVTLMAPDDSRSPAACRACMAPAQVLSPASRKTRESPSAMAAPATVMVVSVVAKMADGDSVRAGGSGGATGGAKGGRGEGGGGVGGGGEGGGGEGRGGWGEGGGGEGSGGIGNPGCRAKTLMPGTNKKSVSSTGLGAVEKHNLYVPKRLSVNDATFRLAGAGGGGGLEQTN